MKKLKVILLSALIFAFVVSFSIFIILKFFLPEEKIKSYIVNYAKTTLNREVSFDKLSFNLIGINLENFSMSEKSTFEAGTFIKSDKFVIKIALLPLLQKEIKINNILMDSININITKDKDGMFNFDDMIKNSLTTDNGAETKTEIKTEESSKSGTALNIDNLNIKNAKIIFKDEQNKLDIKITDFNLNLQNFSFTEVFTCYTSFTANLKQNKLDITLPLKTQFKTNLNNFDSDKLFINIESFETVYNNAVIDINGTMQNINNPTIDCNIILKNIDETTFKDFFQPKTKYAIDSLSLKTKSTINISSMTATVETLSLILPESSANIAGTVGWGKQDIEYDIYLNADILVDNFAKILPEYNLQGRLKSKAKINQNYFDGTINFDNISSSGKYGNLSKLNSEIYLKAENKTSLHKIDFKNFNVDKFIAQIKSLNAVYNDANITVTAKAEQKNTSTLNFILQAKNISNDTISNFYDCKVKFIVPSLDINAATNFNLKTKSADITKFDVKLPQSSASVTGNVSWRNKKNLLYNVRLNLDLLLDNIAKNFPEYNLKGKIKSKAKISNNDFSGNLICENTSFDYLPFAAISKLNLNATAKSKANIVITNASGIFNTGNFQANASYINNDVKLNLKMDKLIIKTSSATYADKEEHQKIQEKQSKQKDFNLNIYTKIIINEINIPYLISKQAVLNTSLKSVTSSFKKSGGTFDLSINNGKITNVNKLAENKFARAFLLVFNVLNNNIKNSGKVNSNEKGIDYDEINCNLLFTNGLMKTNNVFIKLPITTIDAKGVIDFKSENIDMKVNTGLYAAMKISGTLENPKTSFDLAATAAEILSTPKGTIEEVGKKLGNSLKNIFNNK